GSASGDVMDYVTADVDGETLTLSAGNTSNGTLTLNTDGTFSYVPNQDFDGVDSFTYTVTDLYGVSSTGTIYFGVGTLTAPTTQNVYLKDVFINTTATGSIVASNPYGLPLTAVNVSGLTQGTVSFN